MLSERITVLYSLLKCTNTGIARFAGCSCGNISRLKTGNRVPKPGSRSIAVFAEGVYGYADYENMLPLLRELCGAPGESREELIPAIKAWLYGTEEIALPGQPSQPRTRQALMIRRKNFGEKLDRAMQLLDLSNAQLAALLNIDVSLISRYRRGIYSPHGNERLSEKLAEVLRSRAERNEKTAELAALCGISAAELDAGFLSNWLYDVEGDDRPQIAKKLLGSLDSFSPKRELPPAAPALPAIEKASRYRGAEGLRNAVVRFLSDAAEEGGELRLYSDEPMDWMTENRDFFALWASLMTRCVQGDVRIKIIHNVDRQAEEMIDAVKGWFPLYILGKIEPYVFTSAGHARFSHTLFLHEGRACISGFFPAGEKDRRYDYLTEPEELETLKHGFEAMLSEASPFLKTFTPETAAEYRGLVSSKPGDRSFLLSSLPPAVVPEDLLGRVLSRSGLSKEQKKRAFAAHRRLRRRFCEDLKERGVNMILCAGPEDRGPDMTIDFSQDLTDISAACGPEEYGEIIAEIIRLVKEEKNFHLALMSKTPFKDIQITTMKDAVAVLRRQMPFAAFVFLNPILTDSVSGYLASLHEKYAKDRRDTVEMLQKMREMCLK
ncbi:MAG: hypothetical protein II971_01220 [Firmicutes bacterium]|nr:hypothetical protein [Bacillota bacterium]